MIKALEINAYGSLKRNLVTKMSHLSYTWATLSTQVVEVIYQVAVPGMKHFVCLYVAILVISISIVPQEKCRLNDLGLSCLPWIIATVSHDNSLWKYKRFMLRSIWLSPYRVHSYCKCISFVNIIQACSNKQCII